MVLVAVLAVVSATVVHAPRGSPVPLVLARALRGGLVVGLVSVVGIGWFFWRNRQLYGSALGYGVLPPQLGRAPVPTRSLWLFRNPDLLVDQLGLPDGRALATPAGWLVLVPVLRSIDPRLREAASVLGAGPGRVLASVDFPFVARGLGLAVGFAFATSLGEFGATSFLARPDAPTLPVVVFRLIGRPGLENQGTGMAAAVVLAAACALVMAAAERMRPREATAW